LDFSLSAQCNYSHHYCVASELTSFTTRHIMFFQRGEPMHWTPYLDECLRVLSDTRQCETDQVLVFMVRAQLICNRAAAFSWENDAGSGTRAPKEFHLEALQSQLDELKSSVPADLQSNRNDTLFTQLNHADICDRHSTDSLSKYYDLHTRTISQL